MDENIIGGKFSIDISDLSKGLKQANRLINLSNSEFKAATAGMDKWQDSAEGVNARIKNLNEVVGLQEKKVEALKSEYNKLINEGMDPTSKQAVDLQTKINKETAALESNRAEIKRCEEGFKNLKKPVKEVSEGFTVMKGAMANLIAEGFKSLVSAVINGTKEMINFGIEYEKAMNKLQVTTGATKEEMEQYDSIMSDLYKNNYGESIEDVGNAMALVVQSARDLDPTNIQELTKNAILLRDAFGFEVNETMRAANMLIDQFGISGTEAFNLISQGAQNGLDKNGDLLDSINEYSVHYKQLGYSSEEFLNSLINGTLTGTFSVDKLGDAMKEFGIRTKDTAKSTTEGFELIGLDADKMRKAFAKGGDTAKEATETTLKALFSMDDQVKQNQAGVNLFGTMWEDLGIEGIKALTNVQGEMDRTTGTMQSMEDTLHDDVGSSWKEFGRTLQIDVLKPLSKELLPKFKELLNNFKNSGSVKNFARSLSNLISKVIELGVKALPKVVNLLEFFADNLHIIAPLILTLVAGFKAYQVAVGLATVAQKAFNLALNANLIGVIIGAVAGLATVFGTLAAKEKEAQQNAIKKEIFDGQGTSIDALTQKIKENTTEYGNLNNKINELGNTLVTNRASIDSASSDLEFYMLKMQTTGAVTEEEAGQIKSAFETIKNNIQTNLETSGQLIVTLLQNKVHEATDAAGIDFDTLSLKIMEFNGLLGGQLDNIEKEMQPFLEKMANGEALNDEEKSTFLKLRNQMIALDSKVSETQTKWNDTLANMDKIDFGEDTEAAKTAIANLNTYATELLGELDTSRTNALNEVDTGIAQVNALFEQNALTPEARDEWLSVWEQVRENINTGYTEQEEAIKTQLKDAGIKIQDSLDTALDEAAKNAAPTFWQSLVGGFGNPTDVAAGIDEKVRRDIQKTVGDPIQEELDKIANTVGYDTFNSVLANIDASRINTQGDFTKSFNDISKAAMEGTAEGIKQNEEIPKKEWKSFTNNFIDYAKSKNGFDINSPSKKMMPIGKYVMQGFEKGILNQEASVKYNVVSAMKRIVNAARQELDINSPSGVFEVIGKFLMQGLEVGIDKESTNVVKKVKAVGSTLSNSMKNQLTTASTSLNATANLGVNSNNNGLINGITKNVVGGKSIVVNQTINSPKALSRSEIYRQTKNIATSIAQGG